MRVLSSVYGSRSDVGPTVGLAVHVRGLGARECDGKVAIEVLPIGLCR
jgi:hypothetical protein